MGSNVPEARSRAADLTDKQGAMIAWLLTEHVITADGIVDPDRVDQFSLVRAVATTRWHKTAATCVPIIMARGRPVQQGR